MEPVYEKVPIPLPYPRPLPTLSALPAPVAPVAPVATVIPLAFAPPPPPSSSSSLARSKTPVPVPVPTVPIDFQASFASLSMYGIERLYVVRFPPEHIAQIGLTINQNWSAGLRDSGSRHESFLFQLRPVPLNIKSEGEENVKIKARRLLCAILQDLYNMGWIIKITVDVNRRYPDTETMIFRYQRPAPPPATWMCVSFDGGNVLTLIDAPSTVEVALATAYGSDVKRYKKVGAITLLTFHAYTWYSSGTSTVKTRLLVLTLVEVLEQHGFSVYAALDQNHGDELSGANTLFCYRYNSWVAGTPVYHA